MTTYDRMARRAAAGVIGTYSSSFSLAVGLLPRRVRADVRNLYAVVRIADEIVDGAAARAGADPVALLDDYERAVLDPRPLHTDPVLHAWAGTARRCRIDPAHMRAFFRSMRADATGERCDIGEYIHGSAEVVGLMCLDIFAGPSSPEVREAARRLGAAFQKANFVRDVGEDVHGLGRAYVAALAGEGEFTDAVKDRLLDDVEADLAAARPGIAALPRDVRPAVAAAEAIYADLVRRLRATPAADVLRRRVRVPGPRKALLAARAVVRP